LNFVATALRVFHTERKQVLHSYTPNKPALKFIFFSSLGRDFIHSLRTYARSHICSSRNSYIAALNSFQNIHAAASQYGAIEYQKISEQSFFTLP